MLAPGNRKQPPDEVVHSALGALAAWQDGQNGRRHAAPTPRRVDDSPNRVHPLGALVAGLVPIVAAVALLLTSGTTGPACSTISYALVGSPPPGGAHEVRLALDEIEARTGLRFAGEQAGPADLVIAWSPARIGVRGTGAGQGDGWRVLGRSMASWSRDGRTFVSGSIVIDATADWRLGLDRRDALAAVLVHELGHVVRLPHADDPSSFMFPTADSSRPTWTATEVRMLAEIGRRAGCAPDR